MNKRDNTQHKGGHIAQGFEDDQEDAETCGAAAFVAERADADPAIEAARADDTENEPDDAEGALVDAEPQHFIVGAFLVADTYEALVKDEAGEGQEDHEIYEESGLRPRAPTYEAVDEGVAVASVISHLNDVRED